jgi:hypothetical protein
MKRKWKCIGALALGLTLVLGQGMPAFATENVEQGTYQGNGIVTQNETYQVSFITNGHTTVDVFYGRDYTINPDVIGAQTTEARSDGEIDVSGNGQVNFRVNVDSGYEIESVTADANYKNLKGASDTGVEGIYRLTKITGNVNVTINVRESSRDTGAREDIVINEIESNGDATDWVEIYNKGTKPVDISGWYITDDNTGRLASNKTTPLAQGTILAPGGHYVFDQYVNFDFGLGAPDEVNLFDETGRLVEKYSWSTHAAGVYARIPDGTGAFTDVANSTKGTGNVMTEPDKPSYPNAIAWPGSDKVITYDDGISMFQSDSSGLDFYNGKLYCINNKKGTFWVLDVNKDGTMDYSEGFTKAGKNLAFMADAANPEESNPDAEGITVDDAGNAYAAVERDNNNKNVNCNVILKFNPWENSPTVVASSEWDITRLLPDVPANSGIEAVEWVPDNELEGKLYDTNKNGLYRASDYPDSEAGVFFVALEANGHVYAFILNKDGNAEVISEIDPGIGGAMALDYDSYEGILWVGADDGYGNISAQIVFNGTDKPAVTLVNPPAEMDVTRNNEGFAIAGPEYTVNGLRPVFHFMDGTDTGVLTISYLSCNYNPDDKKPELPDDKKPGSSDTGKPGFPDTGDTSSFTALGILLIAAAGATGSVVIVRHSKKNV